MEKELFSLDFGYKAPPRVLFSLILSHGFYIF